MLSKAITYHDYNDVERTETHYFNLSKAEILEMDITTVGGIQTYLKNIIAANDQIKLFQAFKDMIVKAYGVKSPDGRRLMKKAPDGHLYVEDFMETEAYTELIMELAGNAEYAAEFFTAMLPPIPKDQLEVVK